MNAARRLPLSILFLAVGLCLGCRPGDDIAGSAYPQRPIKVVVPFSAGGGSDTFVRILQRAIDEQQLLEEPLVIVNVPGAGGTIGSRRVKDARPDGYTLLLLHDGILTALTVRKPSSRSREPATSVWSSRSPTTLRSNLSTT